MGRVAAQLHLGGPDQHAGALRELLRERIRATPSGAAIDWVTYYLGDRTLADELVGARDRGTRVQLCLEARPRHAGVNRASIARLSAAEGLGSDFRAIAHPAIPGLSWRPTLHEKLYCFSAPEPSALIGSYNPVRGEGTAEPDVPRELGALERGYNALVELRDPDLVAGLTAHARALHRGRHDHFERFRSAPFRPLCGEHLEVHFWPRVPMARLHPLLDALRRSGRGSRVRIAASHLSGVAAPRALARLARRGLKIAIRTDASRRRTPDRVVERLRQHGIDVERVGSSSAPMHHKFALVEPARGARFVSFGSLNWTDRSLWLSHEIAAIARDPALFAAFETAWEGLGVAA